MKSSIKDAKLITLVLLGSKKSIELSSELHTRIHKLYIERLLAVGNKISIIFFGKPMKFEIKAIQCDNTVDNGLVKEFADLNIYEKDFFRVTSCTKFILFRYVYLLYYSF